MRGPFLLLQATYVLVIVFGETSSFSFSLHVGLTLDLFSAATTSCSGNKVLITLGS